MRWRAVGSVLGAMVLAGAVVVLRGQAPPPDAAPTSADADLPRWSVDDGGLPAREPAREPPWHVVVSPAPAFDAIASHEHVAYVRTDDGMMTFTLTRREERGVGAVVAEHRVASSAPWSAVLHDGVLVVAHGQRPLIEVTAIDARTGAVTELAPPSGHAFRPRLGVLGDEIVVAGRPAVGPRACVLALRPRDGASRVVWCASEDRLTALPEIGERSALWPSTTGSPGRCSQWSRLPAGAAEPLAVDVPTALCTARGVVDSGGWLVGVRAARGESAPAIVATSGATEVRLGAATDVTPCGLHVYWSAPGAPVLYRWRPGADHREVALRVDDAALSTPRCTDGLLSVTVTRPDGGSPLIEVRTLGHP